MASQKSTAEKIAIAPKRARGHLRVAAILDAGAAVFAEKGYDAATMTEVAARAQTAIGSLYRFFPSKDVLAEALLGRFAERVESGLDEILARAPGLGPAALADALVDYWLELASDRAVAIALVDAKIDGDDQRTRLREMARRRLAGVIAAADGTIAKPKAETMAKVVLILLKAVPGFAQEDAAGRKQSVAEIRIVLALYLSRGRDAPETAQIGQK